MIQSVSELNVVQNKGDGGGGDGGESNSDKDRLWMRMYHFSGEQLHGKPSTNFHHHVTRQHVDTIVRLYCWTRKRVPKRYVALLFLLMLGFLLLSDFQTANAFPFQNRSSLNFAHILKTTFSTIASCRIFKLNPIS